jgi:hypothetical protein
MDTERALVLFDYLARHLSILKMMGGEPTVHPDFVELYSYAQKKFNHVTLFTNAKNEKIFEISPRETETITYNLSAMGNDFDFRKLLPSYSFKRCFETMVGSTTNTEELSLKIDSVARECQKAGINENIKFNVTLNCVENIFEHRSLLNKKWVQVVKHICDLNYEFLNFDHTIPFCFWTKDSLEFIKKYRLTNYCYSTCKGNTCYGLINSNFELLYCNQNPVKLGNVFKSSERESPIMSFNRMNTLLFKGYIEKLLVNLNYGSCVHCKCAINRCTGGCFKHKYAPKKE